MPASAFPLEVQAALAALRAGILPNPVPRATDFATCDRVERQIAEGADYQIVSRAGGCFVTTAASRRWPDDWVTIAPGISSSWAWGLGAFALGLAAFGGYLWWRR